MHKVHDGLYRVSVSTGPDCRSVCESQAHCTLLGVVLHRAEVAQSSLNQLLPLLHGDHTKDLYI